VAEVTEGVYRHIVEDVSIGAFVAGRIYPGQASPDATMPYITYRQTGSDHMRHWQGGSGLKKSEFQINVFDNNHKDSYALAVLVRQAFDNFSGQLGLGQLIAEVCQVENWLTQIVDSKGGGELPVYHNILIVTLWVPEAVTP